jgi:hypothetical protein
MTTINLIDIIRDSSITRTIWQQELKCTEDKEVLKILLDSYVEIAMITMHDKEVSYREFYDAVLLRFEENL